jgi:hypothetical protein
MRSDHNGSAKKNEWVLKLQFKGKRSVGRPRAKWFSQVLEDVRNELTRNRKGKIVGR